jgi:hypothetical protein
MPGGDMSNPMDFDEIKEITALLLQSHKN